MNQPAVQSAGIAGLSVRELNNHLLKVGGCLVLLVMKGPICMGGTCRADVSNQEILEIWSEAGCRCIFLRPD